MLIGALGLGMTPLGGGPQLTEVVTFLVMVPTKSLPLSTSSIRRKKNRPFGNPKRPYARMMLPCISGRSSC